MAGQRQPTNLVLAKGKKHLTKDEIAARLAAEVQPRTDDIAAPAYLTATQKKEFNRLAGQLQKLNIMGETDVDALARYVTAQTLYELTSKKMRTAMRTMDDPYELDQLSKLHDRYFKQADRAASALGLTISSRCRLVVPVKDAAPKANKFAGFGGGGL